MTITTAAMGTVATTGGSATITTSGGGAPAKACVYVCAFEVSIAAVCPTNGTVSDGTNTYTAIAGLSSDSEFRNRLQVFQTYVPAGIGNGINITYTPTNSLNYCAMTAFYASGLNAPNPFDPVTLNSSGFSTSGPPSLVSGLPSLPGTLFLELSGSYLLGGGIPTFSPDTGNGWAAPPPTYIGGTDSVGFSIGGGLQVKATRATVTAAPTMSPTTLGSSLVLGLRPFFVTTYKPLRVYLRR